MSMESDSINFTHHFLIAMPGLEDAMFSRPGMAIKKWCVKLIDSDSVLITLFYAMQFYANQTLQQLPN